MSEIVRCPYCVLGFEFRPMIAHVVGTYICGKCGHTARPTDLVYECKCERCLTYRISSVG